MTKKIVLAVAVFVRLVLNPQNAGFARGCNQGLAVAKGDMLVLLQELIDDRTTYAGRMER